MTNKFALSICCPANMFGRNALILDEKRLREIILNDKNYHFVPNIYKYHYLVPVDGLREITVLHPLG